MKLFLKPYIFILNDTLAGKGCWMQFPFIANSVGKVIHSNGKHEDGPRSEAEIASHTIVDCTVLGIPGLSRKIVTLFDFGMLPVLVHCSTIVS